MNTRYCSDMNSCSKRDCVEMKTVSISNCQYLSYD